MVSVKNEYVKCLKLRLLAIVAVACLIPSVVMAAGAPYNTYKGLQMYGSRGGLTPKVTVLTRLGPITGMAAGLARVCSHRLLARRQRIHQKIHHAV